MAQQTPQDNINGKNQTAVPSQESFFSRHLIHYILIFLLAVLLISVYTFILQKNYSTNTLEAAVDRDISCSDAIHQLVSNNFTREDFTEISNSTDMNSERYKTLQKSLNELRTLNSTRYLYTAARNEDGKLIYLIDGLDLDASDFAYPGTYIEDEMIPYIEAALSGQTIYSQEIIDTTWGHIFTACYPVIANDGSDDIIGALCIEMDMESSYKFLESCNRTTLGVAIVAILVAVLLIICSYFLMKRQKQKDMEQKRLLAESALAAEAANKAKSTFLFNMSHDIRTPMNAIIGYAELAEKHLQNPDKLNEYVHNIRLCGKKMLSIIDNILELARIENNKINIEEVVCNLEESFDSCLLMFNTALNEKQQTLTVEKDIRYPYIYIDSVHMSEIVLNIISNAIKYTGEGGSIRCSITQHPDTRKDWCITEVSVTDTGIGMSEEFLSHIFESFSRERNSTISGVEGSELGMGIVKNLVQLMGGTIDVTSKLGEGSTFTVRVPCRIASQEDMQPKHAEQHISNTALAGKRILLAEDNNLNAEIAMELLQEEGFKMERAVNGVECIEMLKKVPSDYYDLILMDIQMPVMDGYTATQKIRKLEDSSKASIPIIAMTANAFSEDRQKALSVGMNDHIAKPIDMNTLIPVLQKYLQF